MNIVEYKDRLFDSDGHVFLRESLLYSVRAERDGFWLSGPNYGGELKSTPLEVL